MLPRGSHVAPPTARRAVPPPSGGACGASMRGRVSVPRGRLATAVQELGERLIHRMAELAAVRPAPGLQARRGLWAYVDRHLAARAVLALHQADLVLGAPLVPALASFCRILRSSAWGLRLHCRRLCGLAARRGLVRGRRRWRRSLQKSVDFRRRGRGRWGLGTGDEPAGGGVQRGDDHGPAGGPPDGRKHTLLSHVAPASRARTPAPGPPRRPGSWARRSMAPSQWRGPPAT